MKTEAIREALNELSRIKKTTQVQAYLEVEAIERWCRAGAMLAQTSTELNTYIAGLDNLSNSQAETIRRLEREVEVANQELAVAKLDAGVSRECHAREKAARDGWVKTYRETLARAEKVEQALGAVITVIHGNAEGMSDCVTAGPQCHYRLPYASCKALLAVLKSDALRHVHTCAPDTGVCFCGHAEKDDSR